MVIKTNNPYRKSQCHRCIIFIMKLTGVQVSILLSRDMHASHLCNESQYPCDEHITETTETEATVCQSLSTKNATFR